MSCELSKQGITVNNDNGMQTWQFIFYSESRAHITARCTLCLYNTVLYCGTVACTVQPVYTVTTTTTTTSKYRVSGGGAVNNNTQYLCLPTYLLNNIAALTKSAVDLQGL